MNQITLRESDWDRWLYYVYYVINLLKKTRVNNHRLSIHHPRLRISMLWKSVESEVLEQQLRIDWFSSLEENGNKCLRIDLYL